MYCGMAVAALIASHTAEEITPKITTTTQFLKRGVKFMLASACCTICETKIPKVAAIRECCFLLSDSFLLPTRSPHSGPYLRYRVLRVRAAIRRFFFIFGR